MNRVIFFGMTGHFSTVPLEKLLTADVDICAVVVPRVQAFTEPAIRHAQPPASPSSDLPVVDPYLEDNISHLARRRDIPVWEASSLSDPETLKLLASFQPDLIVVACFPYIFPKALLQLPRHGCLNLHPSLLPAYRGPVPLFWIARQDERTTGVTLHYLDQGVDTGDIVAQARFDRPDGISGAELDQRCAHEGAELLLAAVRRLRRGSLPRQPQAEEVASYFSWPSEQDFVIPTTWPARRAYNFVRGAENWPLVIEVGDIRFCIRVAISYASKQSLERPYHLLGDELWVQFQPGVLRARIVVTPETGVE